MFVQIEITNSGSKISHVGADPAEYTLGSLYRPTEIGVWNFKFCYGNPVDSKCSDQFDNTNNMLTYTIVDACPSTLSIGFGDDHATIKEWFREREQHYSDDDFYDG